MCDGSRLMAEYLQLHPAPSLPVPKAQVCAAAAPDADTAEGSAAHSAVLRGQMAHVDKAVRKIGTPTEVNDHSGVESATGRGTLEADSAGDPEVPGKGLEAARAGREVSLSATDVPDEAIDIAGSVRKA